MRSGEIWLVNFWPSVGDEIAKTRPAVIVDNDEMGSLGLRIVVPFTDAKQHAKEWHVKVKPSVSNKLRKENVADCLQIKSVSSDRLVKKVGVLSANDIDEVRICLAKVLDLI